MSYSKNFLYNFDCKPVRKIRFPKSLINVEKVMNNLIIKPDKYTIYQISKDDIQELKHIPEHEEEGLSYLISFKSAETFTPKYLQKEEWYVILKGGKRIDLTKKQYNTIKGWFKRGD